jgi:hypothetical protein
LRNYLYAKERPQCQYPLFQAPADPFLQYILPRQKLLHFLGKSCDGSSSFRSVDDYLALVLDVAVNDLPSCLLCEPELPGYVQLVVHGHLSELPILAESGDTHGNLNLIGNESEDSGRSDLFDGSCSIFTVPFVGSLVSDNFRKQLV